MSSKLVAIGSLLLAGMVASIGVTADADNINTSGVVCRNFQATQALDIGYAFNGVRNVNAAPRQVICSVPRSPLPAGVPQYRIHGRNNVGSCTACTLSMYRFDGVLAASQSFNHCPSTPITTNWSELVSFTTLPAPTPLAYASLLCMLPGASAGLIYGVNSL